VIPGKRRLDRPGRSVRGTRAINRPAAFQAVRLASSLDSTGAVTWTGREAHDLAGGLDQVQPATPRDCDRSGTPAADPAIGDC
jgi:hypothetical protein